MEIHMKESALPIRPYSLKELAAVYCCSVKTLSTWLNQFHEDVGPRVGLYYRPKQVRIIVDKLGEP